MLNDGTERTRCLEMRRIAIEQAVRLCIARCEYDNVPSVPHADDAMIQDAERIFAFMAADAG